MKSWKNWLALLIAVTAVFSLRAQALFSVTEFTASPDTLYINPSTGDTLIDYHIKVANVGDASFIGVFKLEATYLSTATSQDWYVHTYTPVDIFGAHDTIEIDFRDVVLCSSTKYGGGTDIIVVWPNADGAMTMNGDTTTVFDECAVSIDPPSSLPGRVTPFPNPATGTLNLDWGSHQNLLESVSIVDMAGREWRTSTAAVTTVDLTGMPQGFYFLQITYKDGVKEAYKLRVSHE